MNNYLFYSESPQNWLLNFNLFTQKLNNTLAYLEVFHPKFSLRSINSLLATSDNHQIEIEKMNIHDYTYITDAGYFVVDYDNRTVELPVGSILVSQARNEGESVLHSSATSIQKQLKYFFMQPFGVAQYYLIQSSFACITNQFSSHAFEFYGLNQPFRFSFSNVRWFIDKTFLDDAAEVYDANIHYYNEGNNPTDVYTEENTFEKTDLIPYIELQYNNEELISSMTFKRNGNNNGFQFNLNTDNVNGISVKGF